mmetsp:Transcript_7702/g.18881  ORF Transcript_7702/g.18881 Transcript_7702/m.18881 type:complete len:223 (-) Transcript_7702:4539-5207(-)
MRTAKSIMFTNHCFTRSRYQVAFRNIPFRTCCSNELINCRHASTGSGSLYPRRQHRERRYMNSWQGHGTDLLGDSLAHNDGVPKIVLHGHSSSGFDVLNMIRNMDQKDKNLSQTRGIVHCTGSILALPSACFLWNVRQQDDLTVDSLAPILLYRPQLEYLFLGSDQPIHHERIESIRQDLRRNNPNLVVESLDLSNAMGTFNVLNGEDRRVAVALMLSQEDD